MKEIKEEGIEEFIDAWLCGIYEELMFWNEYIEKKGGKFSANWDRNTNPDRPFTLEKDIPVHQYGKTLDFIDIGSGPFSRCGTSTDKVILNHTAIDPLADAYKIMKQKAGLKSNINLQTGFVEILDKFLSKNSYDIVHMSNSLDHCFDPIMV